MSIWQHLGLGIASFEITMLILVYQVGRTRGDFGIDQELSHIVVAALVVGLGMGLL